ncbi:MAG: TolB-like protein [Actinomycetia bacterium]|jgi:Tol biopolymer transport system component|nr:TolB-like protein [Actinomycetes bacterium]
MVTSLVREKRVVRAYGTTSSPPAIDADGSRAVFFSAASDLVPGDGNGLSDMFVRDVSAGTTTRVSVDTAGGDAKRSQRRAGGRPSITGDGKIVAFSSFASDLVAGDPNGTGEDVFVRDLTTETTTFASTDTGGGSGPSISDDGPPRGVPDDPGVRARSRDRVD